MVAITSVSASTLSNSQAPLDIKNSSLAKQTERFNSATSVALVPQGQAVANTVVQAATGVAISIVALPPSAPVKESAPEFSNDKKIADSIWEIKNALVKVQAQLDQNRPDIMDDVESHYGMHKIVGGTPSITSTERGTDFAHGMLAVGPASHSNYNPAMTPPWDFTLQNGEIKVFSNKMPESKYQTAKLGEAGYGSTSQKLVPSLSDEQVSHIQTELNKNKDLLHGLNAFYEGLTGYSGTKKDLFITPNGADLGITGAIPMRQLMRNAYLASYSEKAEPANVNETDEAKITRLHIATAKELAPNLSAGINTHA